MMNPIKLLKIAARANRLLDIIQQGSRSYEREGNVSKSILSSKTFWLNLLTAGAALADVLPVPPGTALLITSAINIALRVVTRGPVHVLTEAGK